MRLRQWCFATVLGVATMTGSVAVAQAGDPTALADATVKDVSASGMKFGVTLVRGIVQSQPDAKYIAPPEQGAAGKAIEDVVATYGDRKARLQGGITIMQGTVNGAIDLVAIGTVYGTAGTGTVPVLMARTALQAASDDYFRGARADAVESMRQFLAQNQDKIVADAKLDYESLRTLPPAQIRALLDKGASTFKDLDLRVTDPAVQQMARDLTVASIINTQKATLDTLTTQGGQIVAMDARLGQLAQAHKAFAERTVKTLESQANSISELQTDVKKLDQTVSRIDQRLATQERNMDFVQDFMFDKMDPAKKAEALKNGFMASRFSCADGSTSCEQAKLKSDLIERFQTEAAIQSALNTAGSVLQDANGLLKIASDLNIPTGDAGKVVAYGTVAFNAFSAAASGNYIGAIAGLTGAFGGGAPDPEMSYMQAQFEQMNKKLDLVLENQRKLAKQIEDLSLRLDKHVAQLNERFDTIENRIARVRTMQAMTLNAPWKSCANLYGKLSEPLNQSAFKFDFATSQFPGIDRAGAFARSYSTSLEPCSLVVENETTSLAAQDWFGNFLNVDTSVLKSDAELDQIRTDRLAVWSLVQNYLKDAGIPEWRAFQLYASPAPTLAALRARRTAPIPQGEVCDPKAGPLAGERLWSLLCPKLPSETAPMPDAAAASGLDTAMIPEHAIDVAAWILVEQALVDVHAVRQNGPPVTAMELVKYNPGGSPRAAGEEHTEKALMLLDVAMANTSMLHGDLTVEAVLSVLKSPVETDPGLEKARQVRLADAREVLRMHPYLRRNVAAAFLADRYGIYVGGQPTGDVPGESAYRKALAFAEEVKTGEPFTFFDTLFGPGLKFVRSAEKKVGLELMPAEGASPAIVAPVPEPLAFKSGRLFYPGEVQRLAEAREHAGVRLLDYQALRTLPAGSREAIVRALARTPDGAAEATP